MNTFKNIKLCVFDAYGTLFDINSVTKHYCDQLGTLSKNFSNLWRTKQLEYTWLRSLMNRYDDFWYITKDSLDYTLNYFNIQDNALRTNLIKSYENISCYEEVPLTLSELKNKGLQSVILSNATPNMLATAINNSNLNTLIDAYLSVDSLKIYKPHPNVYQLILEKYNVSKNEVLFVSSNSWDVSGAKSFGFNVAWINRLNNPKDLLAFEANIELKSLIDLMSIL